MIHSVGVVRRIDDLGRIVLPKDVRRAMRISEGDPLEMFVTDTGEIVLRKYKSNLVRDLRGSEDEIRSILVDSGADNKTLQDAMNTFYHLLAILAPRVGE